MSLRQPAFVMDRPEDMPDAFDILVLHRHVRVIHIDPVAEFFREGAPLCFVGEDTFLTACDECFNTIVFDRLFAGDAELFLDTEFDR